MKPTHKKALDKIATSPRTRIGGTVVEMFSEKEMQNWRAYERVRKGGRFNMFDPHAREATGLSRDEYLFVMEHYDQLMDYVEPSDG